MDSNFDILEQIRERIDLGQDISDLFETVQEAATVAIPELTKDAYSFADMTEEQRKDWLNATNKDIMGIKAVILNGYHERIVSQGGTPRYGLLQVVDPDTNDTPAEATPKEAKQARRSKRPIKQVRRTKVWRSLSHEVRAYLDGLVAQGTYTEDDLKEAVLDLTAESIAQLEAFVHGDTPSVVEAMLDEADEESGDDDDQFAEAFEAGVNRGLDDGGTVRYTQGDGADDTGGVLFEDFVGYNNQRLREHTSLRQAIFASGGKNAEGRWVWYTGSEGDERVHQWFEGVARLHGFPVTDWDDTQRRAEAAARELARGELFVAEHPVAGLRLTIEEKVGNVVPAFRGERFPDPTHTEAEMKAVAEMFGIDWTEHFVTRSAGGVAVGRCGTHDTYHDLSAAWEVAKANATADGLVLGDFPEMGDVPEHYWPPKDYTVGCLHYWASFARDQGRVGNKGLKAASERALDMGLPFPVNAFPNSVGDVGDDREHIKRSIVSHAIRNEDWELLDPRWFETLVSMRMASASDEPHYGGAMDEDGRGRHETRAELADRVERFNPLFAATEAMTPEALERRGLENMGRPEKLHNKEALHWAWAAHEYLELDRLTRYGGNRLYLKDATIAELVEEHALMFREFYLEVEANRRFNRDVQDYEERGGSLLVEREIKAIRAKTNPTTYANPGAVARAVDEVLGLTTQQLGNGQAARQARALLSEFVVVGPTSTGRGVVFKHPHGGAEAAIGFNKGELVTGIAKDGEAMERVTLEAFSDALFGFAMAHYKRYQHALGAPTSDPVVASVEDDGKRIVLEAVHRTAERMGAGSSRLEVGVTNTMGNYPAAGANVEGFVGGAPGTAHKRQIDLSDVSYATVAVEWVDGDIFMDEADLLVVPHHLEPGRPHTMMKQLSNHRYGLANKQVTRLRGKAVTEGKHVVGRGDAVRGGEVILEAQEWEFESSRVAGTRYNHKRKAIEFTWEVPGLEKARVEGKHVAWFPTASNSGQGINTVWRAAGLKDLVGKVNAFNHGRAPMDRIKTVAIPAMVAYGSEAVNEVDLAAWKAQMEVLAASLPGVRVRAYEPWTPEASRSRYRKEIAVTNARFDEGKVAPSIFNEVGQFSDVYQTWTVRAIVVRDQDGDVLEEYRHTLSPEGEMRTVVRAFTKKHVTWGYDKPNPDGKDTTHYEYDVQGNEVIQRGGRAPYAGPPQRLGNTRVELGWVRPPMAKHLGDEGASPDPRYYADADNGWYNGDPKTYRVATHRHGVDYLVNPTPGGAAPVARQKLGKLTTQVMDVRDLNGDEADVVHIHRYSVWSDPDGGMNASSGESPESIDRWYKQFYQKWERGDITTEQVAALHGKKLVCYCLHDANWRNHKLCVGFALAQVAEETHYKLHGWS